MPLNEYYLTNTQNGHNKFYEITIVKDCSGIYEVNARHGPIGRVGRSLNKGMYDNLDMARSAANLLLNNKLQRGYELQNLNECLDKPKEKDSSFNRFAEIEW